MAAAVFASVARAEPPTVHLTAEVVAVSAQGQKVEPPSLQAMKDDFQNSPMTRSFSSLKLLSTSDLQLIQGQAQKLVLPEGRTAILKLDRVHENTARITLDVPRLVNTTLTLGRSGAIYQHVGKYQDGALFLALTPKQR